MSKLCFKCGKVKPLNMFYRHPQMADGHLGKCKPCAKTDAKARYYSPDKIDGIRNYERWRETTPERKAAKLRYQQKRRAGKPGTYKANQAVANALKRGWIVRQPCEVCGNPKSEAHHDDYRRPLAVRWLCFPHHRQAHGQLLKP